MMDIRRIGQHRLPFALCLVFAGALGGAASAQETTVAETAGAEALLTAAELQTLVAPVALYPDTLLIQILVAATAPLDVVKADRLLLRSADADPAALEASIKAEAFDPSVEVLALAFPEVLGQMAENVEWTETVGTAMLAQSDDVLKAVQVMRDVAIDTGALLDTEQQVVSRDATTDAVVIQPANPQVVYVPQYDPQVVYNNSLTDALVVGAVTFGTVAIISEIFDDDDNWDDYWGCRNCGGWGGGPIIRDPDIDIDVDGNVNIGNRLDIDRDNVNIDRDRIEANVGWRPDPDRSGEAKDKIAARRGEDGATTLPIERPRSDTDELRDRLSRETGAANITRERDPAAIREAAGNARPPVNRPAPDRAGSLEGMDLLAQRSGSTAAVKRPAAAERPNVARPSGTANRAAQANRPKIAKQAPGNRTKAASNRGGGAKAKLNRR
jgi:hypothetical protein